MKTMKLPPKKKELEGCNALIAMKEAKRRIMMMTIVVSMKKIEEIDIVSIAMKKKKKQ
jgi:hypothetical protein